MRRLVSRYDAVLSKVIEVLKAQEIFRSTRDEGERYEEGSATTAKQIRIVFQQRLTIRLDLGDRSN
jgi:hypothetical protein